MVSKDGNTQWCAKFGADSIHICSFLHQDLNAIDVSAPGREMECCKPVLVDVVYVRFEFAEEILESKVLTAFGSFQKQISDSSSGRIVITSLLGRRIIVVGYVT
jgi:hypothetical protein